MATYQSIINNLTPLAKTIFTPAAGTTLPNIQQKTPFRVDININNDKYQFCNEVSQIYAIVQYPQTNNDKTDYGPLFTFITIDEKSSMLTVQSTQDIPVQSYVVIIKVALKNTGYDICSITDYIAYFFTVVPSTTTIEHLTTNNNTLWWIWLLVIIIMIFILAYYIYKYVYKKYK